MVDFLIVVEDVNVDKRLSDAAVDGVVFIHFPGMYGVLLLVDRDWDCLYKNATSVSLYVFNVFNESLCYKRKQNMIV